MASPLPLPDHGGQNRFRSSLLIAGITSLAICTAFIAGKQIRENGTTYRRLMPSATMRLAQAEEPGAPSIIVGASRLQTADKRSDLPLNREARRRAEEKRARVAAATFEQVYNLVREHFVDTLPGERSLSHGAVRAMIASLEDEQSFFLTPDQRNVFEAEAEGHFAGIGAVTAIRSAKTREGYTEQQLIVVAPLPDSPAARAGLRTGDRITHLDGRYVLGDNPYLEPNRLSKPTPTDPSEVDEDASNGIQGGIGLLVAQMQLRQGISGKHTLTVRRPGTATPIPLTVGTAMTDAAFAETRTVHAENGDTALYLRIPAFTDAAIAAVQDALKRSADEREVVLDLRQNPGIGSLEVAEQLVSLLSSGGVFTIEVGVNGKRTTLHAPAVKNPHAKKPTVVVLTDGGTASFAEALAASLADKGATLVGEGHTFGDGRVQTLYPLPDDSAFTLTTGRFIGPKGNGWEGTGLEPRVALPRHLAEAATIQYAATLATKATANNGMSTAAVTARRNRGTK